MKIKSYYIVKLFLNIQHNLCVSIKSTKHVQTFNCENILLFYR